MPIYSCRVMITETREVTIYISSPNRDSATDAAQLFVVGSNTKSRQSLVSREISSYSKDCYQLDGMEPGIKLDLEI